MSKRAYEVVLYTGSSLPVIEGVSAIIEINPTSCTQEDILSAVAAAGLTPADLRSRTLFLADEFANRSIVAGLYSALVGFAGRRLDFSTGSDPVNVSLLHAAGTGAEDEGRPEQVDEELHVGIGRPDSLDPTKSLSIADVTRLRYARKVTLEPIGNGASAALTQLVVTAALRMRNGADYFPLFSTGTDIVDLDSLRRAGSELRRSIRTDSREAVVDPVALSERQQRLLVAAAAPMERTLSLLGSVQNNETGFWRCTRPSRHRNGDANPSMRVSDEKVRCFRCDTEPVDSLRLVIDTMNFSPDDAADFLTSR